MHVASSPPAHRRPVLRGAPRIRRPAVRAGRGAQGAPGGVRGWDRERARAVGPCGEPSRLPGLRGYANPTECNTTGNCNLPEITRRAGAPAGTRTPRGCGPQGFRGVGGVPPGRTPGDPPGLRAVAGGLASRFARMWAALLVCCACWFLPGDVLPLAGRRRTPARTPAPRGLGARPRPGDAPGCRSGARASVGAVSARLEAGAGWRAERPP